MTVQTSSFRSLSVCRNGYDLHAEAVSPVSSDAPWIVFGNSLVTDLSIWNAQAAALSDHYGVLRYDQLGHGKSGTSAGPVDFDMLGDDLLSVMDAAGIDRAVYVGLSMGVPTGLAAHKMAADKFTALVFSDGQAQTAPGGAAGWDQRIEGARATGMEAFAKETAGRWLTNATGPKKRAELTQMIASTSFQGFELCATALKNYDYSQQLARITCPTILVAGAEDGAMPKGMATKLQPAIARSEMHVIDGAGHVPCFEQPEAFTAILSRFLETGLS